MAHKRSQIVATVRNSASNTKRPEPGGALVSIIGLLSPSCLAQQVGELSNVRGNSPNFVLR